ncbi:Hypothetical_protein [Hexamita inflata]|uniref:Hypothetical_protein n=1 Tax=Hexamita inflata TaxID=28002 RepID=A0AA86TRN4_9EUKA|nr:Hypothetical protein HINF_LOCUS13410 [Hexamita inflata]
MLGAEFSPFASMEWQFDLEFSGDTQPNLTSKPFLLKRSFLAKGLFIFFVLFELDSFLLYYTMFAFLLFFIKNFWIIENTNLATIINYLIISKCTSKTTTSPSIMGNRTYVSQRNRKMKKKHKLTRF